MQTAWNYLRVVLATWCLGSMPVWGLGERATRGVPCDEAVPNGPVALAVNIPLNNTGIGDFKFLNPRDPFQLVLPPPGETLSAKQYDECLDKVRITFNNESADRSFVVNVPFRITTEERRKEKIRALEENFQVVLLSGNADELLRAQVRDTIRALEELETTDDETVRRLREELDDLSDVQVEDRDVAQFIARQIITAKALIEEIEEARALMRRLGSLDKQCAKPSNGTRACTFQFLVPSGSVYVLQAVEWKPIYESETDIIEFEVTFFDEDGRPSNGTGFLAAVPEPKEPPSRTQWGIIASVGYSKDPLLADTAHPEAPAQDRMRSRYSGAGRLDLTQTLGYRARASAALQFKNGDLGESDQELDVSVPVYNVDIFGANGLALRFGKYQVAAPADRIAVNESGEAVELIFPTAASLTLAHIVKRESLTGEADDDDEDSSVTIFQGRNIPIRSNFWRSGSVLLLYGEQNDQEDGEDAMDTMGAMNLSITSYDYQTAGGEVNFGKSAGLVTKIDTLREGAKTVAQRQAAYQTPTNFRTAVEEEIGRNAKVGRKKDSTVATAFSGSLAAYRSEREMKLRGLAEGEEPKLSDGDGTVGLLTLGWTQLEVELEGTSESYFVKTTPKRSFQLRFGYGTGDDPDTLENEGYIGETAGFAPDKIFLSKLASRIRETDDNSALPIAGPGLSNKLYGGFTFIQHDWSPLQYIARWLTGAVANGAAHRRNGHAADKIIAQNTGFRLHHYRFNEPVFGSRDAGWEVGLDFEIEVPKGVKTRVGFGKFFRGDALDPVVGEDLFQFDASVSVTLK